MRLADLHWPEVEALDRNRIIVVMPVGSMEQHGPHLPFQVDVFVASRLAEELEKKIPEVLLVPPIWTSLGAPHGFSRLNHYSCESLYGRAARHLRITSSPRFKRIVLLNGLGGNRASLEVLGQELFAELGLTVNTLAYWDLVPDLVKSLKQSQSAGMGHSGELETSLMLHLAPDLVKDKEIPVGVLGIDEPVRRLALNAMET